MGVIAYSIAGTVQSSITGVQDLSGYMWLFDNPQLYEFDPGPYKEYHVTYRTCYIFMVRSYFIFIGIDDMKLHLPGAGLFDNQQIFGGICRKDPNYPVPESVREIEPTTATFYDESNNPYPSSTAENHSAYLVPPHKITFQHVEFKDYSGGSNYTSATTIDVTRVEGARDVDDMLPPPEMLRIIESS